MSECRLICLQSSTKYLYLTIKFCYRTSALGYDPRHIPFIEIAPVADVVRWTLKWFWFPDQERIIVGGDLFVFTTDGLHFRQLYNITTLLYDTQRTVVLV